MAKPPGRSFCPPSPGSLEKSHRGPQHGCNPHPTIPFIFQEPLWLVCKPAVVPFWKNTPYLDQAQETPARTPRRCSRYHSLRIVLYFLCKVPSLTLLGGRIMTFIHWEQFKNVVRTLVHKTRYPPISHQSKLITLINHLSPCHHMNYECRMAICHNWKGGQGSAKV